MRSTNIDPKKVAGQGKGVLAHEIASATTDPEFYAALTVLPNPDKVLRTIGRSQEVYDGIEYDSHVSGEIRSIRAGILSYEWKLTQGGEETRDVQAFELCQRIFADKPFQNGGWPDVIWNIARAVFHGYAVHEVVWTPDSNYFIPSMVIDRAQRRFKFGVNHDMRLIVKSNMHDGLELGQYKWLLARHMARADNPYGMALFSSCFWPYTFKHHGLKWFAKFIERYGIPTPVGKLPQGATDKQRRELIAALQQLIEDKVLVVPPEALVELLETKGSSHSVHPQLINLCNREMSKALTSQTLSTETQETGARAASETHRERQQEGQESDREMVAATLTQLCQWITDLNFPGAAAPKFEFYQDSTSRKETAETFEIATRYIDVSKAEIYRQLQIPQPKEDEEVVGPQTLASDAEINGRLFGLPFMWPRA